MKWRNRIIGGVIAIALAVGGYVANNELAAPPGFPDGFVYGVDSSYDQLTTFEAKALREEGVTLYVQALTAFPFSGLHQPANRVISLRNAHEAGLGIAGYALVGDLRYGGRESVDFARAGVPDDLWDAMLFVAVDIETSGYSIYEVEQALLRLDDLGKPMVIYTNCATWYDKLGNPRRPTGALLWHAYWDNNPDFDFEHRPSWCSDFGGFQPGEVIGEQWSGGLYVRGQSVDRNIFRFEIAEPEPTPEPTPVPTVEPEPTVEPTATPEPVITPPCCCCCN